jgi:hypothetical protein
VVELDVIGRIAARLLEAGNARARRRTDVINEAHSRPRERADGAAGAQDATPYTLRRE